MPPTFPKPKSFLEMFKSRHSTPTVICHVKCSTVHLSILVVTDVGMAPRLGQLYTVLLVACTLVFAGFISEGWRVFHVDTVKCLCKLIAPILPVTSRAREPRWSRTSVCRLCSVLVILYGAVWLGSRWHFIGDHLVIIRMLVLFICLLMVAWNALLGSVCLHLLF